MIGINNHCDLMGLVFLKVDKKNHYFSTHALNKEDESDNVSSVCSEGAVSDTYQCYLSLPLSQVYLLRQFSNIIKLPTKDCVLYLIQR